MTYDGDLMRTLGAIADAAALDCWDNYEMVAVAPDFTETPLPDHHLTALVAAGWIETVEAGADLHLNVSGAGNYHLGRWKNQQRKRVRA